MKRLAILFIALFFPLAAMANSTVNLPSGGYTPLPGGLGAYVANFYTAALMFGGVLAFAVLMFAAAEYTLSGGNPSKQSDARDRIEQALLGLLLLLGAFIVLNAINPELVDIRLNQLREIKSVDPGLLGRTPGLVGGPCRATSPPCNTGLTCSSGGVCGKAAGHQDGVCRTEEPPCYRGLLCDPRGLCVRPANNPGVSSRCNVWGPGGESQGGTTSSACFSGVGDCSTGSRCLPNTCVSFGTPDCK